MWDGNHCGWPGLVMLRKYYIKWRKAITNWQLKAENGSHEDKLDPRGKIETHVCVISPLTSGKWAGGAGTFCLVAIDAPDPGLGEAEAGAPVGSGFVACLLLTPMRWAMKTVTMCTGCNSAYYAIVNLGCNGCWLQIWDTFLLWPIPARIV